MHSWTSILIQTCICVKMHPKTLTDTVIHDNYNTYTTCYKLPFDPAATVWFPISITLLIYSVVSTAATVAVTLLRLCQSMRRLEPPLLDICSHDTTTSNFPDMIRLCIPKIPEPSVYTCSGLFSVYLASPLSYLLVIITAAKCC